MDELFRFAYINKSRIFNLLFNEFKDAKLMYSILFMKNSNLSHVLLFQDEVTKKILLAGYNMINEEIHAICPNTALKTLELIVRKELSDFKEDSIPIENIKVLNRLIQTLDFDNFFKNGPVLYKLENFRLLLYDDSEVIETNIKAEFKRDLSIEPVEFNFINCYSGLDYGELKIQIDEFNKLKEIHLLNDIKIDINVNSKGYVYDGLIFSSKPVSSDSFVLTVSNILAELKNKGSKFLLGYNSTLPSVMSAVLDSTGIKLGKIEGYEPTKLPYTTILQIENIELKVEELGFGNVTFYGNKYEIDEIVNAKAILKEKSDLFISNCYAKVHIIAENAYEAYHLAYEQVEIALDSIIHIIRNDSPLELYGIEDKLIDWNRNNYVPNPKIASVFYAENSITDEKMITDVTLIEEPTDLILDFQFEERINEIEWYEEIIASAMDKKLSQKSNSVINALKWLRRSWDAKNIEDQVIYTNTAIEFLVSKEKVESQIPNYIRKEIIKKSIEQLNECYESSTLVKPSEDDIKQKLSNALSNVPLLFKFRNMIEILNIPIDDSDFYCIVRIRKRRNEIMHGREKEEYVERHDIWRANVIIGKVIIYKIKQISKELGVL